MNPDDPDWFADEAFWEWAYPFMFPARRFEAAEEEVRQIVHLSGVTQGTVLDLACGPGRHAVTLAREGFTVTGVDRSAFLLGRARRHAEAEGVDVDWVEADMRDFGRPDAYDLAISVYTAFGYFERAEENQRVLESVHASLAPGGKLVFDVLGKESLAPRFVPADAQETEDGGVLFQRRRILDDWTRLRAEWTLVRDSSVQRFAFTIWIYSGAELRRMLEDAGFADVTLYGHLDGRPYDLDARRLVAVATKGG